VAVISTLVFIFSFTAAGFILSEHGVSIVTYFASASIIGLAVGFGSQGVAQDRLHGAKPGHQQKLTGQREAV